MFHESVAHLMRTGKRTTPCSAASSPKLDAGSSRSDFGLPALRRSSPRLRHFKWIDIIDLKERTRLRISSIDLPFTAADIIEADDWLIEQP